jgi:hypothetical protein
MQSGVRPMRCDLPLCNGRQLCHNIAQRIVARAGSTLESAGS